MPRPFTIENGTVSFDPDGDPSDPRISVQALCESQQVSVRAKVSGTLNKATVNFEDVDDPSVTDPAMILAKLLNTSADDTNVRPAASADERRHQRRNGLPGQPTTRQYAALELEIKAGNETTEDQRSYQTYSAAYPLSDNLWFEGSYKTLQGLNLTGASTERLQRDDRLALPPQLVPAYGARQHWHGVDLLWQYKY